MNTNILSFIYLKAYVFHFECKDFIISYLFQCWFSNYIYLSFQMQSLIYILCIQRKILKLYILFNYLNSRTHQLYVDKFKCYFQEIEMLRPSRSLGLRETLEWAPWSPLSRLHCSLYIELFIRTFLLGFCYVYLWTHCIMTMSLQYMWFYAFSLFSFYPCVVMMSYCSTSLFRLWQGITDGIRALVIEN